MHGGYTAARDGTGTGATAGGAGHRGGPEGGGRPIGEDLADKIRQALLEWKVLFFRDQHAFDPQSQLAFAGLWGEPEPNPFFPKGDTVGVSRLAKDAMAIGAENIWHSDHSFMAAPALGYAPAFGPGSDARRQELTDPFDRFRDDPLGGLRPYRYTTDCCDINRSAAYPSLIRPDPEDGP
ncbi:TauD/TfdA dioxygenase family protein [Streptomyces sp. NPDC001970]